MSVGQVLFREIGTRRARTQALHTLTHTHTHTLTHTHTHTHSRAHTLTCSHTSTYLFMHTLSFPHSLSPTHTIRLAHNLTDTQAETTAHARSLSLSLSLSLTLWESRSDSGLCACECKCSSVSACLCVCVSVCVRARKLGGGVRAKEQQRSQIRLLFFRGRSQHEAFHRSLMNIKGPIFSWNLCVKSLMDFCNKSNKLGFLKRAAIGCEAPWVKTLLRTNHKWDMWS